jgi:hypothetical protein
MKNVIVNNKKMIVKEIFNIFVSKSTAALPISWPIYEHMAHGYLN